MCVLRDFSVQSKLTFDCSVRRPSPCKAEFVAMLGCWAATGDVLSADPAKCKEVANALFNCMRTTVILVFSLVCLTHIPRLSPSTPNRKDRPSTIISVNSNGKSSSVWIFTRIVCCPLRCNASS
ncbi:hypothetical protein JVU11DRAFT_501 [Chiua virens]|nr:hypothetical protein JVU11DRAFT_501 [Chiua virens]